MTSPRRVYRVEQRANHYQGAELKYQDVFLSMVAVPEQLMLPVFDVETATRDRRIASHKIGSIQLVFNPVPTGHRDSYWRVKRRNSSNKRPRRSGGVE
jgi:hypothetical protein